MICFKKSNPDPNCGESGFLIDWFAFTTRIYSPEDIKIMLGMEKLDWETANGKYFYNNGLYCLNIKILYEPIAQGNDGTVSVQMSGKGCRAFETFGHGDWDLLLQEHLAGNIQASRFDVAYDCRNGLLDLQLLANLTEAMSLQDGKMKFSRFVSDFRTAQVERLLPDKRGTIILWGSRRSNIFMRVYDKAKQLRQDHLDWIRLEFQLRHSEAQNFINTSQTDYQGDWTILFMELLNKKVRFVYRPLNCEDTNIRRLPTANFWKNFIGDMAKAKPWIKPPMEYTEENLRNFTIHQAGQATYSMVQMYGMDYLIDEIQKHRGYKPISPKYVEIINTHRQLKEKKNDIIL